MMPPASLSNSFASFQKALGLAAQGVWLIPAIAFSAGCGKAPRVTGDSSPPTQGGNWFEDFTARSGIAFTHQVETSGNYLFSESMGSGGAFLDFDNDGRLDVYLIH